MTNFRYTRSQALQIWRLIAGGLLYEQGKLQQGEPSTETYVQAIDFLTQIAGQIIHADGCIVSQQRPRKLMQALQLEGKLNPDESALRRTNEISEDFGPVRGRKLAELARGFIASYPQPDGRKRSAQGKSDSDLTRQLRNLKRSGKQDNK